jgi:hypothetical protein
MHEIEADAARFLRDGGLAKRAERSSRNPYINRHSCKMQATNRPTSDPARGISMDDMPDSTSRSNDFGR